MTRKHEYSGTGSKKGRGMAQRSLDLIEAMRDIAEAAQPITGRGVGYKLFTAGPDPVDGAQRNGARLSPAADRRASRASFRGSGSSTRPATFERVVDMGRSRSSTPAPSPAPIAATSGISSRIASRSGARRAPCAACSRRCSTTTPSASGSMHGFSSATVVHDIAEDDDGRPLIVLYVGDFDPSGMFMSEEDLPERLAKYDGDHVTLRRIALTPAAGARPAVVPGRRQEQGPALQVVRRQLRQPVLGAGRDGPQRSARLRRAARSRS